VLERDLVFRNLIDPPKHTMICRQALIAQQADRYDKSILK